MAQAMSAWFRLDRSAARLWGFKAITNNGLYDWGCYDHVFPRAQWVHIVRHPFDHLHAAGRLAGVPLSDESVTTLLGNWLANVETSRLRAVTGRYHEVKYEELRAAPEKALSSVLPAVRSFIRNSRGSAFAAAANSSITRLPPRLGNGKFVWLNDQVF